MSMHTTTMQSNTVVTAEEPNHNNNECNAKENRFIVKYRQNYYDITEFVKKHPGGLNTMRGLANGDMTARFERAPPHSSAAMYLMQEYKIPAYKVQEMFGHSPKRTGVNKMLETHGIELINDTKSMEDLVDWNKAILPQIQKIRPFYDEWVHKPVDRPMRIFDEWYLEMLTKTPWWLVPLFWVPIISLCIKDATATSLQERNYEQLAFQCVLFGCGILFWTLLEYVLHRWVFHMNTSNASGLVCTLHFVIHGLHHKVPYDGDRLVFPPIPGAVIASILYAPLSWLLPHPRIVLAGALTGYLIYDMMHYYLHYGDPQIQHLYNMKRYHFQHHFAHQKEGFGISSPLWDYVFNTKINLRKLRYQLRWN